MTEMLKKILLEGSSLPNRVIDVTFFTYFIQMRNTISIVIITLFMILCLQLCSKLFCPLISMLFSPLLIDVIVFMYQKCMIGSDEPKIS